MGSQPRRKTPSRSLESRTHSTGTSALLSRSSESVQSAPWPATDFISPESLIACSFLIVHMRWKTLMGMVAMWAWRGYWEMAGQGLGIVGQPRNPGYQSAGRWCQVSNGLVNAPLNSKCGRRKSHVFSPALMPHPVSQWIYCLFALCGCGSTERVISLEYGESHDNDIWHGICKIIHQH